MRISADGFIDVRDHSRVRTPGYFEADVDPMPEAEAMAFLLSHSFPGHRKIVRGMTARERRKLRRASWADSINERMSLLDQVWRGMTRAVPPPRSSDEAQLVQVVHVDGEWCYPVYLDGAETRVLPTGGLPLGRPDERTRGPILNLAARKATA